MAYYGNQPTVGQNQSFKVLDDISSYTETFDGTSTAVVSAANDTLTFYDHRFVQGQRVTYTHGGGAVINGLATATAYYIIRQDKDTIQLAINATNAANGTAIDISLSGTSGTAHTLNIAFDGTNTKFKATYQTGYHVKLTRAAQLQIAINGVVQEPVDSTSPSNGFGIDSNNVIVFSAAPVSTDDFWGTFLASNLPSWEISDNKVDNFDGNSTATNFTLSKLPANNENVLVTINGVVQHPSDATTTRAYKLIGQEIVFTSAPLTGEAIQVRHIGFAGAAAGGVTGFYGRTGNVTLTSADDVTINNITGVAATFTGNVSIGGTLTYTDVTNIDAVGIITAQQGIHIGAGATAGAIDVTTGIATFSSVGIADSIYHIGDGDTSLKFGTDTVTAETAGTERLRIDSSGRVLIGNNPTADSNANLHIEEASGECGVWIEGNTGGAGAYLLLKNNSTSSNPRSYVGGVDAGGQGTSQIEFHNLDNANNEGELTLHTRPSGGSMTERLRILSGGGVGIGDSIYHLGDTNTQIRFPAADEIQFDTGGTNYLKLHRYASVNFVEAGANAHISLADNGSNIRGILIGDGNASSTGGLRLQAGGGSSGFGGGVVMYSHASTVNPGGVYIGKSVGATGSIIFGNSGTGNVASNNEFVRIDSNGKVGIGTTIPKQPVSIVKGRVNVDIQGDYYGVWFDGDSTGENTVKVGRWHNTGGGLFSGISAYGHNNLILQNNNQSSHSVIINPLGAKVAIGTHVTDGLVHIASAEAGSVTANAGGDELVLESSGNTGMSILSPGTGESTIFFGNPGTNGERDGYIRYWHESHATTGNRRCLTFHTAGGDSERLRIKSNGFLGIGTDNPYAPLSLKTGPAASNASNMADKGILIHAPGATDEQIIPISASFVTNAHLPRCAMGFISHPTADPIEGYAGEIGFYTHDAADGSAVNPAHERMRITRSGRVGIGSAAPRGQIDAWGDGSSYPVLRLGTEDYQVDGEDIRFGRKDIGGTDIRYHSIHTRHDGVGGSGNYIHFKIHDAGGDPWTSQKTALKLDGLGRVAVNNATPQGDNKLTVKSDNASQAGANEGTVTGALAMFYGGSRTTISGSNYLDTGVIHIKGQITDADTNSTGTHETGKIAFSGRRKWGAQAWIVHETEWAYNTQNAGSHLKFYTSGLASNGGDESTPGVRLHINKEGKLRHGSGLVSQVYGGGFSISHSGTTKTVTISGLISGSVMFHYGTYSSAGAGQGGISLHISGYQTATHTYDVHVIRNWSNGGGTGITISGVTKNASNCTFTVQNNHGSYTAGSSWHIWGNDEVNVSVS